MSIFRALPAFPPQTPTDYLDNEFVFNLPVGDTIVSASVGSDTTLTFPFQAIDGNTVVVWITGGIQNSVATLTCTITTAFGRTYHRSATMAILPVTG